MNSLNTFITDAFGNSPEIPQITAAMVGISRPEWHYAKPGEAEHEVRVRMKHFGFDVVPVQADNGTVKAYWRTAVTGNFDEPAVCCPLITATDCLPYNTDLLRLAKKLDQTRQQLVRLPDGRTAFRMPVFFLTEKDGRDSAIVGLVADSNLHSRPVFLRSFYVISELEALLSRLLRLSFPGSSQQRAESLREAWQALPAETRTSAPNWELENYRVTEQNDPLEYLSLATLLRLIEGTGYASWLGYNIANGDFGRTRQPLNDWRNYVYHPTRPYRGGDLQGTAEEKERLDPATAPTLLATRVLKALGAAEQMLAILKLRMKNPVVQDDRLDRPKFTQVFTSEFFSDATGADLPAWAVGLRLEPGRPAAWPQDLTSLGFISLDRPLTGYTDPDGWEARQRLFYLTRQQHLEAAPAIGQARPDMQFEAVQRGQKAANLYREKGVWLKNIDSATLCDLGQQLGQESVVYATRNGLAQLLLCDPKRAGELADAEV